MYLINQDIANDIARTEPLATEEMKVWFNLSEPEVKLIEREISKEITKEAGDEQVARAVVAYLPVFAENEAITDYIRKTMNYTLRIQIPELVTAEEAGLFAQLEFMMNRKQTIQTIQLIDQYVNALKGKPREMNIS